MKGKIARTLAAKTALCIRVDALGMQNDSIAYYLKKLKEIQNNFFFFLTFLSYH
jgi:RNA processing factor Prp31